MRQHTADLSAAVEAFATWLEGEFVAPGVNLSEIRVVADLRIARHRYIRMCGDIAKHQLARLANNVKHLNLMLEAAGHPVSEEQANLAIPDFFDWFHRDIFMAHSSLIAQYLNDIRWAIYDYLQPEFRRSYHLTELACPDFEHYGYRFPSDVQEPVPRAMYWAAMNRSRREPLVHRFKVSDFWQTHY